MKPMTAAVRRPGRLPGATRRHSEIRFEAKDQIVWVTIDRPRVLTAFRNQTLDQTIDAPGSPGGDPRTSRRRYRQ